MAGDAGMHRAQAVAPDRDAGAGTGRGAPGVEMDQPGNRLGMGDAGAAAHDLDALDPLQRQGVEVDRAPARGQRIVLAHAVDQDHDVAGIGAAQVQRAEAAAACTAVHHQPGLRGQHVGQAAAAPGLELFGAEDGDVLAGVRRCGREDAGAHVQGVQVPGRGRGRIRRLRPRRHGRAHGQRGDPRQWPHCREACRVAVVVRVSMRLAIIGRPPPAQEAPLCRRRTLARRPRWRPDIGQVRCASVPRTTSGYPAVPPRIPAKRPGG